MRSNRVQASRGALQAQGCLEGQATKLAALGAIAKLTTKGTVARNSRVED